MSTHSITQQNMNSRGPKQNVKKHMAHFRTFLTLSVIPLPSPMVRGCLMLAPSVNLSLNTHRQGYLTWYILYSPTYVRAGTRKTQSDTKRYFSKYGVWTGCGQRQSTPSRQQVARNETEEPLIPLSFPSRSLSRCSLQIGKVSAACSCCWLHSHWLDWTGLD